ncbi:hypothetical protein BT69DRAFT_1132053 [Atractiella rhizophila]|nr:hypothetical protein BT69DRAFT_1132053 [Atractiella rhizophila]
MANESEDISKRQPTYVTITYNPTLKLMKVPLSPTAVASPLMKRRWDNFGRSIVTACLRIAKLWNPMQSRQQRQVLSLPCASISFNFLLSISPACSSSYKSSDFHVITANTTRAGGNLSRLDVDLSAHLFFITHELRP